MKDRILINKKAIPYSFEILLADTWYQVEVNYNCRGDFFTLAIYRDGALICGGEPIVYGAPLFKDIYSEGFPPIVIIPVSEAGGANRVTYDNFNTTVFLSIYDDENDEIKYSDGE